MLRMKSPNDAAFDPYHLWLQVPKETRPPTHYQLLGLAVGEANPEVIRQATLMRSAYVRHFQTGPNADDANRILEELSEANRVLLDPALRVEYEKKVKPAAKPAPRPAVATNSKQVVIPAPQTADSRLRGRGRRRTAAEGAEVETEIAPSAGQQHLRNRRPWRRARHRRLPDFRLQPPFAERDRQERDRVERSSQTDGTTRDVEVRIFRPSNRQTRGASSRKRTDRSTFRRTARRSAFARTDRRRAAERTEGVARGRRFRTHDRRRKGCVAARHRRLGERLPIQPRHRLFQRRRPARRRATAKGKRQKSAGGRIAAEFEFQSESTRPTTGRRISNRNPSFFQGRQTGLEIHRQPPWTGLDVDDVQRRPLERRGRSVRDQVGKECRQDSRALDSNAMGVARSSG